MVSPADWSSWADRWSQWISICLCSYLPQLGQKQLDHWWFLASHPSEKYEFVRLDHPNYRENKTCSKPPTRSHDGSMVLVYMPTWLGYIDGIHVTIYSSTMDPMGIGSAQIIAATCTADLDHSHRRTMPLSFPGPRSPVPPRPRAGKSHSHMELTKILNIFPVFQNTVSSDKPMIMSRVVKVWGSLTLCALGAAKPESCLFSIGFLYIWIQNMQEIDSNSNDDHTNRKS